MFSGIGGGFLIGFLVGGLPISLPLSLILVASGGWMWGSFCNRQGW